jgi:tetratricopeptide (TPR) repeat protein
MGEAGWMPYAEAFANQKAEALKAIELDDSRPGPHLALANAAMNQNWDWATQKSELDRALALGPNSAEVHAAYANYLERIGLTKRAVEESQTALRLDPVSSRSFMNLAFHYYFDRQYDLAMEQMRRAAELQASPAEILFPMGDIYVEKGDYYDAIREFERLGEVPHALGHMGNVYARQGDTPRALYIVEKLKTHVEVSGIGRYEIAIIYAGLKQNDNAFEWLEKAFEAHDKGVTYLLIDPCLDPLRTDPRFQNLVKRVGFPREQ